MKNIFDRLAAPLLVSILLGCSVWGSYIIPDHAVTDAKIQSGGLNTASIANNSITQAKRAALGQQVSGDWSLSAGAQTGSYAAISGSSLSITTTGRPVLVAIEPSGDVGFWITTSGASNNVIVAIERDATPVVSWFFQTATNNQGPALVFLDTGASAASHTYQVYYKVSSGTATINHGQTVAVEL